MTDFRALCKELMDAIDSGVPVERIKQSPLSVRVDAALAQPEPQGPTDEELDEFAIYWWGSEIDERSVSDVIESGSMAAFARAVLDRWGRPAIEPVPVSKRLPGPEDCDAEGRCWFGTPSSYVMVANWVYEKAEHLRSWNTHWAPHWALPLPGVEGKP